MSTINNKVRERMTWGSTCSEEGRLLKETCLLLEEKCQGSTSLVPRLPPRASCALSRRPGSTLPAVQLHPPSKPWLRPFPCPHPPPLQAQAGPFHSMSTVTSTVFWRRHACHSVGHAGCELLEDRYSRLEGVWMAQYYPAQHRAPWRHE